MHRKRPASAGQSLLFCSAAYQPFVIPQRSEGWICFLRRHRTTQSRRKSHQRHAFRQRTASAVPKKTPFVNFLLRAFCASFPSRSTTQTIRQPSASPPPPPPPPP